jgi:hypothetical protein
MNTPTTPMRKVCSCSTCAHKGRAQGASKFGRNNSSPDGLHWYCKICNNEKQRAWKRANSDKVKAWKQRYVERNKERNQARDQPRQLELDLN